MSKVDYGPDETWPTHQNSFWNEALETGRGHGWSYEYLDADHLSGYLRCPDGQHWHKVDKTSNGSEFHAKRATRSILRCPHGTGGGPEGKVKERIEKADRLLGTAETLIDTARVDLVSLETRAEANRRLDELAELRLRLDTVDLTVAELEALELDALEDALIAAPAPTAVREVLDDADENANAAAATLNKVRKHGSLKDLGRRVTTARTQIDGLKARLEEFLPESG